MLSELIYILDNNKQHPAPKTRTFVDPDEWIEVCVGIGKDNTAYISLHKDDYEALKEMTDGEGW